LLIVPEGLSVRPVAIHEILHARIEALLPRREARVNESAAHLIERLEALSRRFRKTSFDDVVDPL
jgi:hypothetical protein